MHSSERFFEHPPACTNFQSKAQAKAHCCSVLAVQYFTRRAWWAVACSLRHSVRPLGTAEIAPPQASSLASRSRRDLHRLDGCPNPRAQSTGNLCFGFGLHVHGLVGAS